MTAGSGSCRWSTTIWWIPSLLTVIRRPIREALSGASATSTCRSGSEASSKGTGQRTDPGAKGIESVKRNAPGAEIDDQTDK
jgi:hypothetical protein